MVPQFQKQSGREWQDDVYVMMMGDELLARNVNLNDRGAVVSALREANFSAISTERLADRAAARAAEIQKA